MIKGILKFSVPNLVNMVIGLFSAVILTRIFAPEIYGVLNVFNTTVGTGLSIVYLGLDSSYIRFYKEPPEGSSNKQLGTKMMLISVLGDVLVGLVITVFFYDTFTEKLFGFSGRLICGLVFVSIFSQIVLRFLNIKYRMDFNAKSYTIQSVLTQVTLKLFVIVAALMNVGVEIVLLFNVLGVFVLSLAFIVIQRKAFFSFKRLFSFSGYSKVFKFAVYAAPLAICINLNNSISQQFIVKELGMPSVGIYSSANYFVTIFAALQGGFANYWSAYMYSNYKDKQEEIKKVNEYLLFAIIIVFSGMILGKDLIYLLIGSEYHESKTFFSLVLCYPMLSLAAETTSYGIALKNKNHLNLISFIISIASNLILAFFLIPVLGLKGAALAVMLSGVILYALRTFFGQKLYASVSDIRITVTDTVAIILLSIIPAVLDTYATCICVILIVLFVTVINRKYLGVLIQKLKNKY